MQNSSQLRMLLAQREKEVALVNSQLKKTETDSLRQREQLGQLAKGEHRLQTLHEHSQEIIFICDRNYICRYVSPSITNWLGFLPREMVGSSIFSIVFAEDWTLVKEVLQNVINASDVSQFIQMFRFRHKIKRSSYFDATVTNLLLDPAIGGILINCQDINARKRAQEQQQFLIHFGEKLLPLLDETSVLEIATSEIGHFFNVSRCFFAEIPQNNSRLFIHSNYSQETEVKSLGGFYPLEMPLLRSLATELELGKAVVIEDTRVHRLTETFYNSIYEPLDIASMVILPFLRGSLYLVITSKDTSKWLEDEMTLLQAVLERSWVALQNARLYQRAQVAGILEERSRIARELHDSLQQDFYGIILATHSALKLLPQEANQQVVDQMQASILMAEGGMMGLRSLIFDLKPEAVKKEGLVSGLNNFVNTLRARYRLVVENALGEEPLVSIAVKEALYQIGREALFNTVKHAQATLIKIKLHRDEEKGIIELSVSDNGRGFDVNETFQGHYGLATMKERSLALGGTLIIESKPGEGTNLKISFEALQ